MVHPSRQLGTIGRIQIENKGDTPWSVSIAIDDPNGSTYMLIANSMTTITDLPMLRKCWVDNRQFECNVTFCTVESNQVMEI